jgi:hypothetical protein
VVEILLSFLRKISAGSQMNETSRLPRRKLWLRI